MATATSRVLSGDRPSDKFTIAVDAETAKEKSGYWKVVVNSVTWAGSNLSDAENVAIDIRPPQFNEENDTPVLDTVGFATDLEAASFTNNTQVVAVLNGVPGPSVYAQGDDTWDILNVTVDLNLGTSIADFVLTVDYTATFVEVTSFSGLTDKSVVLSITDDKPADFHGVYVAASSGHGVYVVKPVTLETIVDDRNGTEDSVPNFSFFNTPTPLTFGVSQVIVSHPISKSSKHTKTYNAETFFVYAVNDGKIDANGVKVKMNIDGTNVTKHCLGQVSLSRVIEWPSDDFVDATFSFKTGFVTA